MFRHVSVDPALYYWSLFFPSLSGAAVLLVAAMLGGYGGLICTVLFPWLARSIFTQYHRMSTYQRYTSRMSTSKSTHATVCRVAVMASVPLPGCPTRST